MTFPSSASRSRRVFARAIAACLISSLLSTTVLAVPETPKVLLVTLDEMKNDIRYAVANGPAFNLALLDDVKRLFGVNKNRRDAVERIAILPVGSDGTLTVVQGETVNFSAIAYGGDRALGGKQFEWSAVDISRGGPARRLNKGLFRAKRSGEYRVTASAEGIQASLVVTVNANEGLPIERLLRKAESERTERERQFLQNLGRRGALASRQINTKHEYDREEETILLQADLAKRAAVRALQQAQRTTGSVSRETPQPPKGEIVSRPELSDDAPRHRRKGGPSAETAEEDNAEAGRSIEKVSAPMLRPPEDDGWGGDDWFTADDPSNAVGNPAGSAPDAGAGNGNFQLAAPALSLGGRGIDVNLALVYNSRLWNKSGTVMKYDSDMGFPAPGWAIGFGKMIYMGANGGCMTATADGTRRSHTGTNNTYSYGSYYSHYYTGKTSDGSFIDYTCSYTSSTGGTTLSGYATLANGTTITYGSPSVNYNQIYPTQITDAQGNYINITYVNNRGPQINTITDTLGRVVTFNYDSNRLISITGPGYDGTTRTYVRLHYKELTLNYAFASGYTTDTPTNTPWVIDAIYYPDTNMGYWFGETDSYSPYGMITKIFSERGMSWSGSAGTQGTVVRGTTVNRTEEYNFPMTPNSSLTDAPTYTSYKDSWAGMDVAGPVETTYAKTTAGGNETITITRPDGAVEKQTSDAYGYWFENEVLSGATVLSKSRTYFAAGAYSSTRPTKIEVTDSLGQMTKTEFAYGTNYNQLTSQKEFNYGGTLYREMKYTYENSGLYTGRHIFNLVKSVDVVDNAGVRLSRTDYEYDNNAVVNGTQNHGLVAAPNVIMHKETSDPYTTDTQWVDGPNCAQWEWSYPSCTYEGEIVYGPPWPTEYYCTQYCVDYEDIEVSVYDPNSIFRGNVTKTTTYENAATLGGPVAHNFTYDITGNQRTATTNCCQQISFDYTDSFSDSISRNTYAYPTSTTKGSPDPQSPYRMTRSATYDFNTGAARSSADFNGRTTTVQYDVVARPTLVIAPTGAKTTTDYGDVTFISTQTVQLADNTVVSKTETEMNGKGQPTMSGYYTDATSSNKTCVEYDAMGRKKRVSAPYASSGSPVYWTEYTYDHLSRVTQVTAPDGSTSKMLFNETQKPDSATANPGQTVRSLDAWGRERWARTDAFGRLVEVVEPNPSGSATSQPVNVAAASNGATATASSVYSSGLYPIASAINGDRKGQGWGSGTGGWNDNTNNSYPDWFQVNFSGSKTINEIDVFTIQDNETSPSEPTETMTFTQDGIIDFDVQYWDGSAWATVPGGSVTGNNKVWRKFTFTSVTTDKIRVVVNWSHRADARYSRIAEVEAWTAPVQASATGSVFDPGSMRTEYVYDRLDQLTQILQGAQTRSFGYDSLGRVTRQKLAEQTATINDAGAYVGSGGAGALWSDAFVYDATSNLVQRTDARGVKTTFSYDLPVGGTDPLNRLHSISYNKTGADTTHTIHDAPGVSIEYMTAGDKARVKKVITAGVSTEENSYDTEGRVTDYTLTFASRPAYPLVTSYQYDTASRLTEIRYPAQYGMAGSPRKVIAPSYDQASRLTELKVDAQTQLNEIVYNPMGQVTSLKTAAATGNPYVEQYSYENETGLLTNQKVIRQNTSTTLLDLSYGYNRGNSIGNTTSGKTGQLTHIINNLDRNKDRVYEHDTLGRLIKAKGGAATGITGVTANWTQDYSYDRYGNKNGTTTAGITADSNPISSDGIPSLSFNTSSNRISATGWQYDLAGNQTRGQNDDGTWLRFEYDTAGRLLKVNNDAGSMLESYTYGASRERLVVENQAQRTYYSWDAGRPVVEYGEPTSGSNLLYSRSYVYMGLRLVSTFTRTGAAEEAEYHHPDRSGTRLVTNPAAGTSYEQSTLPFGRIVSAESSGQSNQVFTSYERSSNSGLDYAVNRAYSSGQSRFTQVDPIGMSAVSVGNPQSLNLYAYVQNKPSDYTDPSGLLLAIDWASCRVTGYVIYGNWDGDHFYPNGQYDEILTCNVISYSPVGSGFPGDGGIGGGTETGPLNNLLKKTCNELAELIKKVRDELAKRAHDLINDFGNLPQSGPMSIDGHAQQFRNKQTQLRNALNDFNTQGCGGPGPTPQIPEDAWSWATDPTPKKRTTTGNNRNEATVPSNAPVVIGGIVVTAATAYVLYRIARMLPSLAPPLWGTIPANLAIP